MEVTLLKDYKFLQASKRRLKTFMNSNSTEIEKSTVAPGIEPDPDIDKEEANSKDTSDLKPKINVDIKPNISTRKILPYEECKSWNSVCISEKEEKYHDSINELGKKDEVLNETGYANVFINKSKKEDDISTDETSKEVGDMSTLESDNLESIKNLGSVKLKTTNQNKVGVRNKTEHKAEDSMVTINDPSNVFLNSPDVTESLMMDRSSGELMNCSNNDHNDEFQDKLYLSLHESKDFNLQEDSNSDESANKVLHFQDSGFQV